MTNKEIVDALPYGKSFLFVDTIEEVSDTHIVGSYKFSEDSFFYSGHFINHPVTPGVILTECMAQIGLVCHGMFLLSAQGKTIQKGTKLAMVENEVLFKKTVYPGEKVVVKSIKQYFRMQKLKSKVIMLNEVGDEVCSGTLSGILIPENDE
ncbi:MAG: hydroxymyristoyl-ACP dehydratase [Leeuwenhoekiella sp.]